MSPQPNIVLILLDNVEAECTPTRAALLTGRLPVRTGCQRVTPPGQKFGLAPWEYTMARMLSDVGYRTAIYGKQLFNVAADPKEMWDIMEPNTWVAQPIGRIARELLKSVSRYPHVPVGGDGPGVVATSAPLTPRG